MGGPTRWPLAEAWEAAAEVTAAAYAVDLGALVAPSRGRGPRPPREAWQAKRTAVHLAVVLSGSDYATLGRHLRLHKDTVAHHCAVARDALATDEAAEAQFDALAAVCGARLQMSGVTPISAPAPTAAGNTPLARLQTLERLVADAFAKARALLTDEPAAAIRLVAGSSVVSHKRDSTAGTGGRG